MLVLIENLWSVCNISSIIILDQVTIREHDKCYTLDYSSSIKCKLLLLRQEQLQLPRQKIRNSNLKICLMKALIDQLGHL